MDTPQTGSQQSSLDSLRTVEFRQTLRGYHIDDVDEYLERVAVEAEALQEQLRQSTERLRQAAERIAGLEQQVQNGSQAQPAVTDDSLQRTLILAQRFVDQTHAEAEAQARHLVSEAEERSQATVRQAEDRARQMTEEAERNLREEVGRLEGIRNQLATDVETIARHLDSERTRLRSALTEMVTWVDEHVQPAASLLGRSGGRGPTPSDAPPAPNTTATSPSPGPAPASSVAGAAGPPARQPELGDAPPSPPANPAGPEAVAPHRTPESVSGALPH
jgi:DivIVA domain-containing protein